MATRSAHRAGSTPNDPASACRRLRDPTRTPRPTRRAPCRRPAPLRAAPRPPGTQSLEMVNFSIRLTRHVVARGRAKVTGTRDGRRALSGSIPPASTVLCIRATRGRACGAGQARNARGEPHHLSGGRREPETRTIEGAAPCGTEQRIKLCAFHGERESMRESALIVVTLGECLEGPRTRTCRGFLWCGLEAMPLSVS
jgi:hypothetical protein